MEKPPRLVSKITYLLINPVLKSVPTDPPKRKGTPQLPLVSDCRPTFYPTRPPRYYRSECVVTNHPVDLPTRVAYLGPRMCAGEVFPQNLTDLKKCTTESPEVRTYGVHSTHLRDSVKCWVESSETRSKDGVTIDFVSV